MVEMGVMKMYEVFYTTKDNDGYLVDRATKFRSFAEAVKFIRSLQNVVGKPLLERL